MMGWAMMSEDQRLPIAVIGAGFSGTMVAVQLAKALPPDRPILLCDRSGTFARGLAYATTNPDHLLNVRASNMSAFAEEPGHFEAWLARLAPEEAAQVRHTPAGSFAARGLYGRYLGEVLDAAIAPAGGQRRLRLEREAVTDLVATPSGQQISFASGRTIPVAASVLACGNLSVANRLGSRFTIDPWQTTPLDDLDADRPILIVGSGLTMIDAIAAVRARGFAGPILAASRRGLVPHTHAPAPAWPRPEFSAAERGSMLRLLRRIRREVAKASQESIGWHSVIDSLRPVSVAIWTALPLAEQRRFLRHLRAYWDVHRHRTATPSAEIIAREIAGGRLRFVRAKIERIADEADHVRVELRERGRASTTTIAAQRLIDATGIASVSATDDVLLRKLLARGRIRPDALGLGLDVAADFALRDADGHPHANFWTIGPLLRGTLWECTAVPDIRPQAVALARTIAAALAQNAGPVCDAA